MAVFLLGLLGRNVLNARKDTYYKKIDSKNSIFFLQSAYFDRDDIALLGFAKMFRDDTIEEREHAMEFVKYQNLRGGRVVLQDIIKPVKDEWGSALEALQAALDLEKRVNLVRQSLSLFLA
jgi:ferritin